MSGLRMTAKPANIKLLYATFNDWMIEFDMSIRTTNKGVYVNTKKKSIKVKVNYFIYFTSKKV